ncbi:MAG: MGMT family protein [Eubacteriales bacterium]
MHSDEVGEYTAQSTCGESHYTANTDPVNVPCHRVVNREGKLAPMYVFGGVDVQKERLENEGVEVDGDRIDLEKYLWR